jgi:hypothetical protein
MLPTPPTAHSTHIFASPGRASYGSDAAQSPYSGLQNRQYSRNVPHCYQVKLFVPRIGIPVCTINNLSFGGFAAGLIGHEHEMFMPTPKMY